VAVGTGVSVGGRVAVGVDDWLGTAVKAGMDEVDGAGVGATEEDIKVGIPSLFANAAGIVGARVGRGCASPLLKAQAVANAATTSEMKMSVVRRRIMPFVSPPS
jgi:hypothetical protein